MKVDRRTFLITSAAAAGALALAADEGAAASLLAPPRLPYDDPAYLIGDALHACVHEPGLGGRSHAQAMRVAMQTRVDAPMMMGGEDA